MNLNKVLKEFVNACSKKLELKGILQFGSSTYSKNFHDVDLVFYFKEEVIPLAKSLDLIKILRDFEKRYDKLVFDFSAPVRKRRGKYSITIVPLGRKDLDTIYTPEDLFFYKNLVEDKNKKILFGEDLLNKINIKLTNEHLFEMLSNSITKCLERSLDDEEYRLEASYFLFKTFLRTMLVKEGTLKKEDLLEYFKKIYKNEIKLPENAKNILAHKLVGSDFKDILKFSKDCLRNLLK